MEITLQDYYFFIQLNSKTKGDLRFDGWSATQDSSSSKWASPPIPLPGKKA
jgi:hypothetical protein